MEKLKQKQFEEFTKQQEKEQEQLIEEFVCIQRHH